MQKIFLMTFTQITLSSFIKENFMMIIIDKYSGIYCKGQTQPSIALLKGLRMIGTQEHKSHQ